MIEVLAAVVLLSYHLVTELPNGSPPQVLKLPH